MGYMNDIVRELREFVPDLEADDGLAVFVKEKLLESYKNGLRDARNPRPEKGRPARPARRFDRTPRDASS